MNRAVFEWEIILLHHSAKEQGKGQELLIVSIRVTNVKLFKESLEVPIKEIFVRCNRLAVFF